MLSALHDQRAGVPAHPLRASVRGLPSGNRPVGRHAKARAGDYCGMSSAPRTLRPAWRRCGRDSGWCPAAFAAGAVLLALGLSVAELRLGLPTGGILPSSVAGARSLLSSIITAMISFTALVFSITVVAVQLASSQYSPRVLRTFLQTGSPRSRWAPSWRPRCSPWWCWRRCRPTSTPTPGCPICRSP
nr:DUF2254 family protein [Micromonospora sp. WMMB482]